MSTTTPIIAELQQLFETLLADVRGPAMAQAHADQVERELFQRLLELGAGLLQLHFDTRAATAPAEPVLSPDGTLLQLHDRRSCRYVSIFGELSIRRHAYHAVGQPVVCPLDAALSLPAHCYSPLLREWAAYGSTDSAYRETQTLLERLLGLRLSVQALETCLAEDAAHLLAFDAQAAAPAPDPQATILVAQADGKGVPIVQPRATTQPARPSSGRPPHKMKEAIVTAVYRIAPYVRTPQDIVAVLLHEEPLEAGPALPPRPRPVSKQLRATLEGKTVAVTRLAAAARRHDGPAIQGRVALCDGAEALQDELRRALPGHTLVLDIIHATEYLWEAANALLGERHPERQGWMRTQLTALLQGQTAQVIATLQAACEVGELSQARQDALTRTMRYYRRNQPWMHYDQYLLQGWPIGTGVVESACGHLVKDRLQQAGMRWTVPGAQVVLNLRAARLSGEWDAYWTFQREQQHQQRYGTTPSSTVPVDTLFLQHQQAA